MRYLIEHETRLALPGSVREHHCELRLTPRQDEHQKILSMHVEAEPTAALHEYEDCFGNRVHHFSILAPHDALVTRVRAEVETTLANPFDYAPLPPAVEHTWIEEAMRADPWLWIYLVHHSPATPDLTRLQTPYAFPHYDTDAGVLASVLAARDWIAETFHYDEESTQVHSPLEQMLEAKSGVCQDFAHLLVALVRSWGIPARYVMGYQDLEEDEEDAEEAEEEERSAAEQPHAWAEVLVPGAGWRGVDPAARLVVNDHYVAVAVGRNYLDAAPQRGSFKGGDQDGEQESASPDVRLSLRRDQ